MQKLIIKGGKAIYVDLTPEEEVELLSQKEGDKAEASRTEVTELKQQLARELTELREMKLNPDLFTADDIAEQQAIVDKVTEKLETRETR